MAPIEPAYDLGYLAALGGWLVDADPDLTTVLEAIKAHRPPLSGCECATCAHHRDAVTVCEGACPSDPWDDDGTD